MHPENFDEKIQQRNDLREQVFRLRNHPGDFGFSPGEIKRPDLMADPELSVLLQDLFQRTAKGQREALAMELDELRRLVRCAETERIFRAFGVLILATPVRWKGRTVHACVSGPLKVSPWNPQEKKTLAALCGVAVSDLPSALDEVEIFAPAHVRAVERMLQQQADWISRLLDSREAPPRIPDATDLGSDVERLQPGVADHLEVLFSSLQRTLRAQLADHPSRERLLRTCRRGWHLAHELQRLSAPASEPPREMDLHAILREVGKRLETRLPSLRLNFKLEAEAPRLTARPSALIQMVSTLLAAVADGLPEGRSVIGISTRLLTQGGRECLQVEIRDGGGLATFAGVDPEQERLWQSELADPAAEFADWITLASSLDAEIRILRGEGAVTRAELFLPTEYTAEENPPNNGTGGDRHIWIVEDDQREFETLRHLLADEPLRCHRFTSARELREKFSVTAEPPDLVLLKYHLPDERGVAVRTWLYEQDADLPVILISSLEATHPGIATANSLPSTLYLQKPFDRQALVELIRMNLNETAAGN